MTPEPVNLTGARPLLKLLSICKVSIITTLYNSSRPCCGIPHPAFCQFTQYTFLFLGADEETSNEPLMSSLCDKRGTGVECTKNAHYFDVLTKSNVKWCLSPVQRTTTATVVLTIVFEDFNFGSRQSCPEHK